MFALDFKKVGIYALIIGGIGIVWTDWLHKPSVRPDAPPEVVLHSHDPTPPEVVSPPFQPPAATIPEPQPPPIYKKRKPRPEKTQVRVQAQPKQFKPKTKTLTCRDVPPLAFQYPQDVVMAAAERRGLTPPQLALLRKCLATG